MAKVAEYGLEGRRVAELVEYVVRQRDVRRGHLLARVLMMRVHHR